jgi:hypothetical protein
LFLHRTQYSAIFETPPNPVRRFASVDRINEPSEEEAKEDIVYKGIFG